ncbi:Protein KINESIN LIGHT CHAIN-RELATED 2 [Linum perenne]
MISSGENPKRALEFAIKATKSFEECSNDDPPNLEYVMSLHVLASIHCILGQYSEAIPVLEKSIEIPVIEYGQDHSLAKFAGCMQLGDTYAMLGQIENSILCYTAGLEIQKQVLGEMDPRVGETCRYVAEAHVQALQFEDAAKICQLALDIHREKGGPSSMEEAADRRLMGLICDARGDHEAALEHYVLVSMSMAANGQEMEVAAVDCSIGDAYLSLARYDEAICAYQKALASFKSSKDDAIEILEQVVRMREQKLGTANPEVVDEKRRLAELLKEAGRTRERESIALLAFLDHQVVESKSRTQVIELVV